MELAERLKLARESMRLEQKEIASLLRISFRSWQDYEAGKSVPGGKVFEALVKAGFNANWLLTGQEDMLRGNSAQGPTKGIKSTGKAHDPAKWQPSNSSNADLSWFHKWIEEELQAKSISEIMAIAVKMKTLLDENKVA